MVINWSDSNLGWYNCSCLLFEEWSLLFEFFCFAKLVPYNSTIRRSNSSHCLRCSCFLTAWVMSRFEFGKVFFVIIYLHSLGNLFMDNMWIYLVAIEVNFCVVSSLNSPLGLDLYFVINFLTGRLVSLLAI